MSIYLKDFTPGPLDFYRKIATFDWKKLKVFLDSEKIVQCEKELCDKLKQNSLFLNDLQQPTSLKAERLKAMKLMFATREINPITLVHLTENLSSRDAMTYLLLFQINPSGMIKYNLSFPIFMQTMQFLGTERHLPIIEQSLKGEIVGCFCLTEVGHGSNTKAMQTTATYDSKTKKFVLHTPNFKAAKCWSGSLGKTATHAVIFAQLIVEGKMYGLHCFIIQIRDTRTLKSLPGIIIGDMGHKIGLNGIDNGFMLFDHHQIPRENLLNKHADVTENGQYITQYENQNERHAATLGGLSIGRAFIIHNCVAYSIKAITIAIRYAAVRRQFGPDDIEIPILEYQNHQYRLLPYLALTYVLKMVSTYLLDVQYDYCINMYYTPDKKELPYMGLELHILCSGLKSVSSLLVRDAVQECREACGGHGYLKVAGLGSIRDDHDANITYEGDSHVIIQQTSKWLINLWPHIVNGTNVSSPLNSVNFLTNALDIINTNKFDANNIEEICLPNRIISAFQWLVCYLLKISYEKYDTLLKNGKDKFWAKDENQVFYANKLATVYVEHFTLQYVLTVIDKSNDPSIKNVLYKLFALYGLWSLEKHSSILYQGGFAYGPLPNMIIKEAILKLCNDLKNDAVSLVDVIAPPDFVLNSVLGASDGMVYKHLQQALMSTPEVFSRPSWWQDVVYRKSKI